MSLKIRVFNRIKEHKFFFYAWQNQSDVFCQMIKNNAKRLNHCQQGSSGIFFIILSTLVTTKVES